MSVRFLGCMALISVVSCSASREVSHEMATIAVAAPSSITPAPPAPIAIQSATPIASASDSPVALSAPVTNAQTDRPSAYPEEWIQQARSENIGLSCLELVYKNGCSETRTGTVTFQMIIDENGTVEQFSEVDNQIRHDKAVVSRCLKKNLPRWKFHAPEGNEKTFQFRIALSDKC